MRITIMIIFTFFSWFVCDAQFSMHLEGGYGYYLMSEMRDLQKEFISNSGLPLEKVSSFPAYVNYGIGVGFGIGSGWEIGTTYRYNSTGGRVDYADYSGRARIDQLLQSSAFGVYVSRSVNHSIKWPLTLNLNLSRLHTKADFTSLLQLGDEQPNTGDLNMKGNAWGAMVSLFSFHRIGNNFFVFGRLGFEAFANKELHIDKDDSPWKADWSGPRAALGIGFSLNKKVPITE